MLLLQIICLSAIVTLGLALVKACRSWLWKIVWGTVFLGLLLFLLV